MPSDHPNGVPRVHYLPKPALPAGLEAPWEMPKRQGGVDILEVAGGVEPSGRQVAVKIATQLAERCGAAPDLPGERAASPAENSALGLLARAREPALHEAQMQSALIGLRQSALFPHYDAVDSAMHEVAKLSASHCVEEGLLIEYMRRHYAGAVNTSHELLRVLQTVLTMYERLREVTDERLLERFQQSVGDALSAINLPPAAGEGPATGGVEPRRVSIGVPSAPPLSPGRGSCEVAPLV